MPSGDQEDVLPGDEIEHLYGVGEIILALFSPLGSSTLSFAAVLIEKLTCLPGADRG